MMLKCDVCWLLQAANALTGHSDRRPHSKPGAVKLVDVQEVRKLNKSHVASPHSSGSVLHSQQRY